MNWWKQVRTEIFILIVLPVVLYFLPQLPGFVQALLYKIVLISAGILHASIIRVYLISELGWEEEDRRLLISLMYPAMVIAYALAG